MGLGGRGFVGDRGEEEEWEVREGVSTGERGGGEVGNLEEHFGPE